MVHFYPSIHRLTPAALQEEEHHGAPEANGRTGYVCLKIRYIYIFPKRLLNGEYDEKPQIVWVP